MKVAKALKRLIALPCVLALALIVPTVAFADETAAITTPGTVSPGEDFTVQVSFSSDENIGSIKATLDYDSDVIEFVSGNFAVGGGGICNINAWSEFPSPQQNFELTFHAVSQGSSQIVVTRCSVYSETGDLLGAPTYIGSVTVSEAAATQSTTPQPTTPPTQTATEEVTTTTETTTTPEAVPEQPQSSEAQAEEESIIEETPVTQVQPESSYPEKEKTDTKDDKGAITAILITVGAVVIVGVAMTTGGSKGGKRRRKR